MNPLFVRLNVYDDDEILSFDESIKKVFGYIRINHYHSKEAHTIAFGEFIKKEQFTHMILMSTDLIVKHYNVNRLLRIIDESKLHIYSGVCNIDPNNLDLLNCCIEEVDPHSMAFDWIPRFLKCGLQTDIGHCGLALLCIDRETAKEIPLLFDKFGHNFDVYFNRSIKNTGKMIVVDFDNFCYHKRYAREEPIWTEQSIETNY